MCFVTSNANVLIKRSPGGYAATSVIDDETGDGIYSIFTYKEEGQLFCSVTWDNNCGEIKAYEPVPGPMVGKVYKEQLLCMHREKLDRMENIVAMRYFR